MNFPVPWRCLLPSEAADFVLYNQGAVLRELSDQTGAMIDVSTDRDTPTRLSDRIVTISGQAEQKEGACRGIIERLRRLQDLADPKEPGIFVLIVPATAIPVVVGAQGATIKEVLAAAEGIDLSIGKENIMHMPDTPIGLEGTVAQVVAAAAAIHRVIQDMADRGRLLPSDFKYRPDKAAQALASGAGAGLPEFALPPVEHKPLGGLDPTQNFRTKAKVVVDSATAGWLIGKGGRQIRQMQENSGAFLHILREEDTPATLRPGERLIEICGRYERKLEGIQVVLRTADSIPGTAPRETLVMVPSPLATAEVLQEVSSEFDCALSGQDFPGFDESVVTITGPTPVRIQIAQAFLTRTDKAHMDGTVVALSIDGEQVGRDGRARRELRGEVGPGPPQASGFPRQPPPSSLPPPVHVEPRASAGAAPRAAAAVAPQRGVDHEASACVRPSLDASWGSYQAPSSATASGAGVRSEGLSHGAATAAPPTSAASAFNGHQHQHQQQQEPSRQVDSAWSSFQPSAAAHAAAVSATAGSRAGGFGSASGSAATPVPSAPAPAPSAPTPARHTEVLEWRPQSQQEQPQQPKPPSPHQFSSPSRAAVRQDSSNLADRSSSSIGGDDARAIHREEPPAHQPAPEAPTCPAVSASFAEDAFEQRLASATAQDSMDKPEASSVPSAGVGSAGGFAFDPGFVDAVASAGGGSSAEMTLAGNARLGHVQSKLVLLVSDSSLQRVLVPSGHLQAVARRCQVHIDLDSEVKDGCRQVMLKGTVLGNAAAAFWIQAGINLNG